MSTQKALVLPEKNGEWKLTDVAIPSPGPTDILVKVAAAGLNPIDWKNKEYNIIPVTYPFISGVDGSGIVEAVGADVTTFAKGDRVCVLPHTYISHMIIHSISTDAYVYLHSLFQGNFVIDRATFQQYAIATADLTAKVRFSRIPQRLEHSLTLHLRPLQIPENITLEQAATVPLGLATVTTGIWARGPGARSVAIPAPWEEGGETQNAGKPILVLGGTSNVGQYGAYLFSLSLSLSPSPYP